MCDFHRRRHQQRGIMRGKTTDPQMRELAKQLLASGKSVRDVSAELDIPYPTVGTWLRLWRADPNFIQLQQNKKQSFAEKAAKICDRGTDILLRRLDRAMEDEDAMDEIVDQIMNDDDIPYPQKKAMIGKLQNMFAADIKAIGTIVGTMYDKMRLAMGQSTEIVEGVVKFEDI